MHAVWRLASGAVFASILVYLGLSLLPDAGPLAAFVTTVAIGFLGGVVARSWWAVALMPVAVMAGREVWSAIACSRCPIHDEDTTTVRLMLNFPFFGDAAALGAAAGALLGRRRTTKPA
jgi:hypothetical protein